MTVRLILDTNVLLSALMSRSSPSAQILSLWLGRRLTVLTCEEQLDEIARVTRYPRIRARLLPALAGRLINRLRDVATVVENLPALDCSPDPEDNYLLALAEAGDAQFLVTGDKLLLELKRHKTTRIVTPSALLELVEIGHQE